ncbi:MAG: serine/threonine protein kinase [Planctomycetota bacterium]|jgi:serine/threonine protein kinase
MPLQTGQSLTFYEIIGPLGAGGMGEVYRAKDTRLDREVAIKVLPDDFAKDEERLQRFAREAKTLASLNHPNVGGIFGVDEHDGKSFLALELVPGEDLGERLARNPLPVSEAIDACCQIAKGLEAAHEAGVVHRDLKPANVRMTPEGIVKILDFGLAKPIRQDASGTAIQAAQPDSFMLTSEGLVLGTPTYMSPEQARGRPVDRRTDIWAFGCVLYECLTGTRAFYGDSVSDLLAAILEHDPDWSRLPSSTPKRVRALLGRCLQRDPQRRLRDIGEARIELEDAIGNPGGTAIGTGTARTPVGSHLKLALVAAVSVAAGAFLPSLWSGETPGQRPPPARLQLDLAAPDGTQISAFGGPPAFSSDGQHIAFVAIDSEGDTALWIRDITDGTSTRLPGTTNASHPFWAPSGLRLGFTLDESRLMTIGIDEAEPRFVAAGLEIAGGSWSRDGTVMFRRLKTGQLMRVDARGGAPEVVCDLTPESTADWVIWSSLLPGGNHFLFSVQDMSGQMSGLYVGTLDSREVTRLSKDVTNAYYVESGHLLHRRGNSMHATPFDLETLTLGQESQRVAKDVRLIDWPMHAVFGASPSGRIVYLHNTPGESDSEFVWFDPATHAVESLGVTGILWNPRLSRDQSKLAFDRSTLRTSGDVWIRDLARGTENQIIDAVSDDSWPVWSPSGDTVYFYHGVDLFQASQIDGWEPKFLLAGTGRRVTPFDITPDGRYLLLAGLIDGDPELVMFDLETREQTPLARGNDARLSPDGAWIVFRALSAGRQEVMLATFPAIERMTPVSSGGGDRPRWSHDGRTVFFVSGGEVIAVPIELGADADPVIDIDAARVVVPRGGDAQYLLKRGYAVASDGRLLMIRSGKSGQEASLTVLDHAIDQQRD